MHSRSEVAFPAAQYVILLTGQQNGFPRRVGWLGTVDDVRVLGVRARTRPGLVQRNGTVGPVEGEGNLAAVAAARRRRHRAREDLGAEEEVGELVALTRARDCEGYGDGGGAGDVEVDVAPRVLVRWRGENVVGVELKVGQSPTLEVLAGVVAACVRSWCVAARHRG